MKAVLLLCVFIPLWIQGSDFYVSSDGAGDGTLGNPGSLTNAVAHNGWASTVAGGDTVWLRGGVYSNPKVVTDTANVSWMMSFSGAAGNLVTWRSYSNEWAKIDRQWRFGTSKYHRFRDLEFYDSFKGNNPTNISYPNGPWAHFDDASIGATSGNEWINCVIHDVCNCWSGSTAGTSVRGCILWHVGLTGYDHVSYASGSNFVGNISAWHVQNFINLSGVSRLSVKSNIVFGSAQIVNASGYGGDILLGTHTFELINNCFYNRYLTDAQVKCFSIDGATGQVASVNNNIIVAPLIGSFGSGAFDSISFQSNIVHMASPFASYTLFQRATSGGSWTVDFNQYTAEPSQTCRFEDTPTLYNSLAAWQAGTGLDSNSKATNSAYPADVAVVIPNQDQLKRAHIAIYNWTRQNNVSVDVSGVLSSGDIYSLYSVQNYNAGPIKTGTFSGSTITVPMTNLTTAPVLYGGNWGLIDPPATSPEFGAFVLIGASASGFNRWLYQ